MPDGADPVLEETILDAPLDLIRLIAPTTQRDRIAEVAQSGQGFLYYISRTGVTGARDSLSESLATELRSLRETWICPWPLASGSPLPSRRRRWPASRMGLWWAVR